MANSNRKNGKPPDVLPANVEAERATLGYYLVGGEWCDSITAQHFTGERKIIYYAMAAIHAEGGEINVRQVSAELGEKKQNSIPPSYLSDLSDGCDPRMKIEPYIAKLKNASGKRDLLECFNIGTNEVQSGDRPADEIIKSSRALLAGLSAKTEPVQPKLVMFEPLLAKKKDLHDMLFEDYPLPACGVTLKTGPAKAGKTVLAVQEALALALRKNLFGWYRVRKPGPVMVVEVDDPAGEDAIASIVQHSGGGPKDTPFFTVVNMPFTFGSVAFIEWLEKQINSLKLVMVVLDSYTALRGPRGSGLDFVKAEQAELSEIDALGKRLQCAIQIIHHDSTGKAGRGLEWTQSAAGSFAMSCATEAQMQVSRFAELDIKAPERLIRIRGRHAADTHLVIRYRKETEDYDFVLENSAAELFPLLKQIHAEFADKTFAPADLAESTGLSRQTITRKIERLREANLLIRLKYGQYRIASGLKL
jgi:hypothetical protein